MNNICIFGDFIQKCFIAVNFYSSIVAATNDLEWYSFHDKSETAQPLIDLFYLILIIIIDIKKSYWIHNATGNNP